MEDTKTFPDPQYPNLKPHLELAELSGAAFERGLEALRRRLRSQRRPYRKAVI